MIVVAFALPEESRNVVAALRDPIPSGSPALPVVLGKYGTREVMVIHTGVGPLSACDQLRHFEEAHGGRCVDAVIGAGFAGGLDPALPAGTLILAENYPERLGDARRFLENRARVGRLASAPAVLETPEAKAQCARETGALAVDMESATVAAFFRERGVPFLALRVISDTARDALPIPSRVWFDPCMQRPRPWGLLRFLLRHPGRIWPFVRFVLTIGRARRTLTAALLDLLAAL